jgi:hypothetical protein
MLVLGQSLPQQGVPQGATPFVFADGGRSSTPKASLQEDGSRPSGSRVTVSLTELEAWGPCPWLMDGPRAIGSLSWGSASPSSLGS